MKFTKHIAEIFTLFKWRIRHTPKKDEISNLRSILRDSPSWARGHLELGLLEIELYADYSSEEKIRAIAAIKVSASAILRLSGKESFGDVALQVYARYLFATAFFLANDYQRASDSYQQILVRKEARYLLSKHCVTLLENSAACAMALSRKEEAEHLLSLIPEELRSQEVRGMLGMFA